MTATKALRSIRCFCQRSFSGPGTRLGGPILAWLCIGLFFSGFFAAPGPIWAATDEEIAYRRLYFGLQQPTDRDAERLVELIVELLKDGRVSEAAPLVEAQFAVARDHLSSEGRSLKATLAEELEALEPASLRRLQSVLRRTFERRLAAAKTPADWRQLVAKSPSVVYGPAALAGLARAEEDAGSYHAAARAYDAAIEAARTASDFRFAKQLAQRASTNRRRLASDLASFEASQPASPFLRSDRSPLNWCGVGGDARRLGRAPAEPPLRWQDWKVGLPASPSEDRKESDFPAGMACGSTVAAAGVLVTRTPDGLTAIRADSGRRVWRRGLPQHEEEAGWPAVQRGLSTDGSRVYTVVDGPGNALVAYDLPREGKTAWRVDAGSLGDAFGDAQFLGPPAADKSHLYALIDSGQTISLVVIDAKTGEVGWRQPLTGIPNGRGARNAVAPVSPTLGERLVYCPTGAGAVVAVDPLRRRLVWTHYLSITESDIRRARSRGWRGSRQAWNSEADAWRHARAIEADGLLTIVSPTASLVETLDSSSGESLWTRTHKRGLLLAGVTDDLVLLVEREKIVARRRSDGKQAWSATLPEGDTVCGEGLLLGDRYVAPLASGRLAVAKLSPESRNTACGVISFDLNPLEDQSKLGDLLAHQGALYSRADRSLVRLRPTNGPGDALDQAIIALGSGDIAAARNLLQAAREDEPTNLAIAEALAATTFLASVDSLGEAPSASPFDSVSGPHAASHAALLRVTAALQQRDTARATRLVERLEQSDHGRISMTPDLGWSVSAARLARGRLSGALADEGSERTLSDAADSDPRVAGNSAWSLRQVEGRVAREDLQSTMQRSQRRRDRKSGVTRLATRSRASDDGPIYWRFETHHGVMHLLGLDRWGDLAFTQPLPGSYRSTDRRPKVAGGSGPKLLQWEDRIALPIERATVVFHVPTGSVAWRTDTGDREKAETPVAMGPWGVITKSPELLRCRRLSDREVVWSRDITARRSLYPRVIAVADELFIATDRRSGIRLSAWSGEPLGDWTPPWSLDWGDQAGANMYVTDQRSGPDGYGLRDLLVLPVEQAQQPLLRLEVTPGALLSTIEGDSDLIAMLTEDRQFTLVDVRAGEVRFVRQLGRRDALAAGLLRVRRWGDDLLVEVGQAKRAGKQANRLSAVGGNPLLTGELHCLDAQTGVPTWAQPAEVSALSLLSPQADCPLLLLTRRAVPPTDSDRGEAILSLVALDPATGATVYRNHDLPAGDESRGELPVRVQYESSDHDKLLIRMGRVVVNLSPTGPPAPPRPPYVARVEDPLGDQRENANAAGWLRSLLGEG